MNTLFRKFNILILCLMTYAVGTACGLQINVTVQQPTCGSNGTLSYTITPTPSNGARFRFFLNGSFLGTLNGNQASFNSLQPGTYKLIAEDLTSGCIDSVERVLNPPTGGFSATHRADSTRCDTSRNGRITLVLNNAIKPITYQWSPNTPEKDSIADSLAVGEYNVTITDGSNCPFTISKMQIKEIQGKMLALDTIIKPTSCDSPNGEITILVSGRHTPIAFKWVYPKDSLNMPLDSLGPGSYTCIFEDTLKCYPLIISSIPIVQNKPPKAVILGTDTVCRIPGIGNLRVQVTAGDSNQLTYDWDNGVIGKTRQITDSGWYSIRVADDQGCADTPRKYVNLYPEKFITLKPDLVNIVKGNTPWIAIDSPAGLYNIVWSSSPTDIINIGTNNRVRVSPEENTIYSVFANYGPKCEISASTQIFLIDPSINITIPNIFTPNGDSRNDTYSLIGSDNTIETFEFKIFDRWGNIVHEAYNQNFVWDGKNMDGKDLANGVYPYVMRYTTLTQRFDKIVLSGTIILEK